MDNRLSARVRELAEQLLADEKTEFRSARTLRDLEELTGRIGDELARQLVNLDLSDRAGELRENQSACCPDCGRACPILDEPEPILLQGRRGDFEYLEPRCCCPSCRRDFFPSGRLTSAIGSGNPQPGRA